MNRYPAWCFFTSAAAALAGLLAAQSVPAPKSDEIVELSKFEVSATASRGYVTTSSLSASRIAVPITELPASVVVINEKLIEDTMAIQLQDTLSLVSGIQQSAPPYVSNEISMRGYTLATAQRDGLTDFMVSEFGGFDYAFVERIEIVKGPSGILYGTHNPGGIVNLVSKRPLTRPKTKLSFMGASYNTYRAEVDVSNFFDAERRFGYRVAAVWADTDGIADRPKEGSGLLAINPSVSFRSKSGWHVWAWAGIIRDHMRRMNYGVPALPTEPDFSFPARPSTTGAPLYHVALNHILRNDQAWNSNTYELGVNKGFDLGPVRLDVRVVGRDFNQDGAGLQRIRTIDAFDVLVAADGSIIGTDFRAVPYAAAQQVAMVGRRAVRYDSNPLKVDGRSGAADFNFGFNVGPTRHQLLTYVSYSEREDRTNTSNYDVRNVNTLASLGMPIIGGAPLVVYWPRPLVIPTVQQMVQLADRVNIFNDMRVTSDQLSFGAIERLSFWDDRAFLVGGFRRDQIDGSQATILRDTPISPTFTRDRVNTRALSALVKAYKGENGELALYVNSNKTFIPVNTIDRRLATFGQRYPNRLANNDELGVKIDFLQSRAVATIAKYRTKETNVLFREHDDTGSITGIPGSLYDSPIGVRTTRGWEADLNVAPLPGWEVILAYSKATPRLADGLYAQKIAFNTFSVASRYEFLRGRAKGLAGMWQYNHWGRSALSSRSYWLIPGGDLHTAILSYQFKQRWSVRLRVENVFDKRSVYPSNNETALDITRDRNYRGGVTYSF
jgi:outer membrane receptor protein involved in Fe transport